MQRSVVFIAQLVLYLLEPKKIPNGLSFLLSSLTVLLKKSNAMDVVVRKDLFFVSKTVKCFPALKKKELIFVVSAMNIHEIT